MGSIISNSGGGAPSDVAYLLAAAAADPRLPNAVPAGAAPLGELGGTWAAPTVDATHAGSPHAARRAYAFTFGRNTMGASLTDSQLYNDHAGAANQSSYVAPAAAKVTGIAVRLEQARTTGTATFQVFKNGVDQGATYDVVIDGTNTQKVWATYGTPLAVAAGDHLDVRVTTDATFGAGSGDVSVALFLQED